MPLLLCDRVLRANFRDRIPQNSYDPDDIELVGLIRSGDWLEPIAPMNGWTSPRLGIRFELTENNLKIYRPDGRRFLTSVELDRLREEEYQRAEAESQRASQAEQRAESAETALEQERRKAEILAERLRQMGINPEELE